MRLFAYLDGTTPMMGVDVDGRVAPLTPVREFYADVPAGLEQATAISADMEWATPATALTPAVPVPETAKIVCAAINYQMHADETGTEVPELPNFFARWYATLVPDGTPIPVPDDEPGLDWEVELAVVIGASMSSVTPSEASAGILGYTVFNDVSARRHQRATKQWANGKNADASGPIGSAIVTADAIDPDSLALGTRVNGAVMQDGRTSDMLIKIPDLIAYATRTITLRPGDVIATGTPDGVGFRRDPPVLLHPGDTVEVHVEGVGSVRNPLVDASHRR
ncbi:MAG: fumarylacetoacetate hydrolase family protein [Acidimicrobiales bacterium]